MMKNVLILFLIIITSFLSCKQQPSYCEAPYKVNEIKLIPSKEKKCGNTVIIKNDTLIWFFTKKLCEIENVKWSTDRRIEDYSKEIEIQLNPENNEENKLNLAYKYYSKNYYFREGTTYFKNDTLTQMVVKLTGIDCSRDNIPNKIDTIW